MNRYFLYLRDYPTLSLPWRRKEYLSNSGSLKSYGFRGAVISADAAPYTLLLLDMSSTVDYFNGLHGTDINAYFAGGA